MSLVKAAVIPEPHGRIQVREFVEPELEENSAVLQVEFSEVCGTDVHLRDGCLEGVPYPLIPGHVSCGYLSRIRGDVLDLQGRRFREGDRVTFLDVHRTCHSCWYCLVAKASTRCPKRKVYGITYGADDGLSGGWSEQVYLKPGTRVISLEGVDSRLFMAGGCSLPTALHAVERGQIRIGEIVLVLGSGPVGLSAVALARLSGAAAVLCIGAPEERLRTALEVGASDILDVGQASPEERREWVLERTGGRGADLTLEATGRPEAVVQAMRWTRDAGRVVVVGQYTDLGDIGFNPHADLNRKHLDIKGCWGSDFSHFFRAVEILRCRDMASPWGEFAVTPYGLGELNEALGDVAAGRVVKALVDPHRKEGA